MSAAIDWDGRSRQPCPQCGRGERDRTLHISRDDLGAVCFCHRCQFTASERGERAGRPMPRHAGPQRHESLSDYGRWLWDACRPVSGPARAYLVARGCMVPPADGDLRGHPALKHPPSGYVGPALVGRVTHAQTGEPLTLHRTWVQADGRKANVDPARLLLGGHAKKHGVIRLWPDDLVSHGLAVAEGVESALSVAHAGGPVWACIDAGNLADFQPLPGIECLTIAADHDPAGIDAAQACAARWAAAGREVFVVMPPEAGRDLNDVARAA